MLRQIQPVIKEEKYFVLDYVCVTLYINMYNFGL